MQYALHIKATPGETGEAETEVGLAVVVARLSAVTMTHSAMQLYTIQLERCY